ncbi:hypothetical protein T552_01915 [Pneumocystis carinii B80]|uniref:Vacuolar protein-sorting-associated protein 36 n=1 Tax=Pneumocystis carinii (strain B80) TaxID=1408658 RepID=A0A0W4ZI74_PNEC8|nr:hypothetical protein T552_01915 [Pneumocystis carinii B80]KTW28053.1 hypothetical protein T552_01915 [Pneumocystis carinii B80]
MKHWKSISVTQSDSPVLFSGEKILFIQPSTEIYDSESKGYILKNGMIYLTTHRICYLYPSTCDIQSLGLNLSQIEDLKTSTYFFFKSNPKIIIYYKKSKERDEQKRYGKYVEKNESFVSIGDTWICEVCSFSNPVPESYSIDQNLPPCLACGVSIIKKRLLYDSKNTEVTVSDFQQSESSLSCKRCTFFNHPALKQCESCGSSLVYQEKKEIYPESLVERTNQISLEDSTNDYCKIKFKSGGERLFYERLKEAINQKEWMIKHNPVEEQIVEERKAGGISVLHYTDEIIKLNNARILNQGLSSLNALMSKAKELVALANSLRLQLQTSPNVSHNILDTLQISFQTMGLESSMTTQNLSNYLVTKEITKDDKLYYIELAKQVAEFLESGVLKKEGGIMTLVDVFALYNRARGRKDLISPEDLFKACQYYETLNVSIQLKRFKSGLLVLQEKDKSEEKRIHQLVLWIQTSSRGVSIFEVADQFHWSMGIAYETLKIAEEKTMLCRDKCFEGLYFWQNLIIHNNIAKNQT